MVELHYVGRLGNQLALHCLGRGMAERLGFRWWAAKAIAGFAGTQPVAHPDVEVEDQRLPVERIVNRHRFNLPGVLANPSPRRLVLSGPFLRYEYFRPHKMQIRQDWLAGGDARESFTSDDLTIHVRTGDLWRTSAPGPVHPEYHALPFSYYGHVIKQRRWKRIFVIAEHPDDPMVEALARRRGALVLHGTPLEDFARLRASRNIVLSVSSFAWWAGWLSQAERIFFPLAGLFDPARANRRPWHARPSLWVDDEHRYAAIRPSCPLLERDWQGREEDRQVLLET